MHLTETSLIEIVVNGSSNHVPAGLDMTSLLSHLGIAPDRVAIELNGAIVRKPDWAGSRILPGAKIEIVQFVGGG